MGRGKFVILMAGRGNASIFLVSYPENGGVLTERLKCSMVMGGFAGN